MSVETDSDRLRYLADFGETVTKTDSSTFTGILDAEEEEAETGGIRSVLILSARTSDCSGLDDGDAITVAGNTYAIRYRQDDGTGMTTLTLRK